MKANYFFEKLWRIGNENLRKRLTYLFIVLFVIAYAFNFYYFCRIYYPYGDGHSVLWILPTILGTFVFPYILLRLTSRRKDVAFVASSVFFIINILVGPNLTDSSKRKSLGNYSICLGVVRQTGSVSHRYEVLRRYAKVSYECVDGKCDATVDLESGEHPIPGDIVLVKFNNDRHEKLYSAEPDSYSITLYKHPVLFINFQEFGNDYYYYAKLRPDLSLKNFGLNKLTMNDNLLYYRNVNDSIDSQIHKCPDSLQTSANREMLDTSGYAFYFHGEIVPKEQVFEEVPKAREYYERYCGKAE